MFFLEAQRGGAEAWNEIDPWFHSTSADTLEGRNWAVEQVARGRVARLWRTNSEEQWTEPPVHFPATDVPSEAWYQEACEAAGCVK